MSETEPNTTTAAHAAAQAQGSALQKYQDLMLGRRSLLGLLQFEVFTLLFFALPGLLGFSLRKIFYPFWLGKMEKGVLIGSHVNLRQPKRIRLFRGVIVDAFASLNARCEDPEQGIFLHKDSLVGRGSVLDVRDGKIILQPRSNLGASCRIGCSQGRVVLGEDTLVGAFTYIGGGMHHTGRTDIPMAQQGQDYKGGVEIEADCWIGAGCQILDGVKIGTGSIIGAGSVVTKDIPAWSVAVGVPAKVIRKRDGAPE